ncbi:MAG: hypothetical protein K2K84_03905 [Muribaculaceae bacterium]|nr:hypothetical protein [Muribaculaceae bacterium]
MKKLLLIFSFMLACISLRASYAGMKYTTDTGAVYYTYAHGLVITTEGDSLIATVDGKEQLRLKLTSVVSMELVAYAAGVESVKSLADGKIAAYSLDGMDVGQFQSVDEARRTLSPGIYILKDNSGQTIKIQIGK